MDPFLRFPAEITQEIIRNTGDFASVENLIRASPQVKAVFLADPYPLLHYLLSSHPVTFTSEIRRLVSSIVLARSLQACYTSVDEYKKLDLGTPEIREQICNPDTAAHVLHTAARIQRLSCICLTRFRANLVAAVGSQDTGDVPNAIRGRNAGRPFAWIEEYRIQWALWHLQHYADLQNVHNTPMEPDGIVQHYRDWNNIDLFMAEQIWAVASELVGMGFDCSNPVAPNEAQSNWLSDAAWGFPGHSSIPFIRSLEPPAEIERQFRFWSPPAAPAKAYKTETWLSHARSKLLAPGQMRFFRSESRDKLAGGGGRLYSRTMMDVAPYRRLGVFLWDDWRMFSVGLLSDPCLEELTTTLLSAFESVGSCERIYSWEDITPWEEMREKSLSDHTVSRAWLKLAC
ncbi:hypothetical protein N7468_003790 [Penicillium chermesinum]|uniref:Uncharacterized protein n=1 Tax=Penicillium chermesinum TaxID=63820 RepID=A0A9W9P7V5_9EURO|nr:uncharacterized protein N7468_003790 [Penicillium chermesinum]KAJ5239171.1 hypothetical protein N7468_003790 [Penicillium chermesinum]KAJ6164804.1 hypothetical protein N7470_003476 [Penicillium chermesinum]